MTTPSYDNPRLVVENGPVLTVTVSDITDFTNDAAYKEPADQGASVFTDYAVQTSFMSDPHTYMLGITSPDGFQGASVAFCQLAATTLLWTADWTASRYKTQPQIPDPNLGAADWVFLGARMEPAMITVAADGLTPLYRISGTYLYGKKNPSSQMTSDFLFPLPPWLEDVFDRTMPADRLQQGIIKPPDLTYQGPNRRRQP
jgi:hypothetical protein